MDIADVIIAVTSLKIHQVTSHHFTVHIIHPRYGKSAHCMVNQLISITVTEDSFVTVDFTTK
jgi:hypothetical protein